MQTIDFISVCAYVRFYTHTHIYTYTQPFLELSPPGRTAAAAAATVTTTTTTTTIIQQIMASSAAYVHTITLET